LLDPACYSLDIFPAMLRCTCTGSDVLSAKSVVSFSFTFVPSHCRRPRTCIFVDIYKPFVRRSRFSSVWENETRRRDPKQSVNTIRACRFAPTICLA
jgi:hypothetical protein